MNLSTTACKRIAAAIVICIVATAILWWGIWSIAAGQYRGVIDGWIESGRAAGYQITYDQRELFGFPTRVVLRFTNLHWRNTDGISFHVGDIDIGAIPWQWQTFKAKFKDYAEIDAPLDEEGRTLLIGSEKGVASVKLDKDGFWKFSSLKLSQAKIGRAPDFVFTADKLEVSGEQPADLPQNHRDTGLTLTGMAENLTLPPTVPSPFGQKMAKMTVDMRIMDVVPDFRRRDSVSTWNKDSGVVEFDELHMEWGSLIMTAKGTMGFDDDLQPEGAFAGAVGHEDEVLKALMEGGFIAQRQEGMLSSAMHLFAKPSKFSNVKGVEIPITVQLGGLFLGPVKIFSFPEIVWPINPPTGEVVTPAVVPASAPAVAPAAAAPATPEPAETEPAQSQPATPSPPASPPAAAPP